MLQNPGLKERAFIGRIFVDDTDLVVTNHHVVSQIALDSTFTRASSLYNDQRGTVELLAVDVLHDLAVVRVSRKKGFLKFRAMPIQLAPAFSQSQYLYSLGESFGLGFAISEGA